MPIGRHSRTVKTTWSQRRGSRSFWMQYIVARQRRCTAVSPYTSYPSPLILEGWTRSYSIGRCSSTVARPGKALMRDWCILSMTCTQSGARHKTRCIHTYSSSACQQWEH
eukprot:scaffold4820_cov28-Tisochrysis_lutea.AAC.3